jgi:hypothetical protein
MYEIDQSLYLEIRQCMHAGGKLAAAVAVGKQQSTDQAEAVPYNMPSTDILLIPALLFVACQYYSNNKKHTMLCHKPKTALIQSQKPMKQKAMKLERSIDAPKKQACTPALQHVAQSQQEEQRITASNIARQIYCN